MGKIIDEMMAILHPKKVEVEDYILLNYGAPGGVWMPSVTTELMVISTSAGPTIRMGSTLPRYGK